MKIFSYVPEIILFVIMLVVIYNDFKYRLISTFALIAIFCLTFVNMIFKYDFLTFLLNGVLNILFLFFLFLTIKLYFKLRKEDDIINKQIGAGDLYYFVCLIFAFTPVSFMFYLTFTFIISLIWFLISRLTKTANRDLVPLAGIAALLFVFYQSIGFLSEYNLFSDYYYIELFT